MTDDRSPRLLWTDDGAPHSGRFGDVYFSREDGLAESRAVFLTGCGLPEAWAGRRRFTVAELGFGTGLNIAALLDLWRRERPAGGRLHVFTVEGFPLTRHDAARALSTWPELAEATEALLAAWPEPTPGFHRMDLPGFDATVDVAIGDAAWALSEWSGLADGWFLDGFAPSTNPGMWTDAVMDGIVARSAPDARLATFTVAGTVRRGLAERGFVVEKRPGHGRKRERLEARLTGAALPDAPPSVAVIGAGIAGASMARALAATGLKATVVEQHRPGAGGSGFPAALVTPRLDAGDEDIAALHARALSRATDLYAATPDAVIARGVLQLEQAPRDAARFDKVAAQRVWAADSMTPLDTAACSTRVGEPVEVGGLMMSEAIAVRPAAVLADWLAQGDVITGTVDRIEATAAGWRLIDPRGQILLETDVVVIAGGWGAARLLEALSLSPVRGQADWVEGMDGQALAWGGYAVPTGSGLLFGATHDRGRMDVDVDPADSARNLETLSARLPRLAARVSAAGPSLARAAVRATTPDRLPVAGPVAGSPGLWVLGGLGSRGFCVGPLLAEHVAAEIAGTPSPLPRALAARVDPGRKALAKRSPKADA